VTWRATSVRPYFEGVPGEIFVTEWLPYGEAVHVQPINPMLKAPGIKRLKLRYDTLLSNFALNFNLRRFPTACRARGQTAARGETLSARSCCSSMSSRRASYGTAVQADSIKTRVESVC
jgi:hypothetical protein